MGCGASKKANTAVDAAAAPVKKEIEEKKADAEATRDMNVNDANDAKAGANNDLNNALGAFVDDKDDKSKGNPREAGPDNDNGEYVDTANANQGATHIDGRGIDPTAGPALDGSSHHSSKKGEGEGAGDDTTAGLEVDADECYEKGRKVGDRKDEFQGEWAEGGDDDPFVGLGELEDMGVWDLDAPVEAQHLLDPLSTARGDDESATRRSSVRKSIAGARAMAEEAANAEPVEISKNHEVFRSSMYGLEGDM
jgi:hypothetical protein